MRSKIFTKAAVEAESQLKFGLAAKMWRSARDEYTDLKERAKCTELSVRCDMEYTKRMLELNQR